VGEGPNQLAEGRRASFGRDRRDRLDIRFVHDELEANAPNHIVCFEPGDPICMIVPYPRGLLDSLVPQKRPLDSNREIAEAYKRWSADRDEFHHLIASGDNEAIERGWQKDYFQGRDPGSTKFEGHQTKLGIKPFA
jgi:Family of unknown function (DUF6065)